MKALDTLLTDFAKRYQMQQLEADGSGRFSLTFDGHITLTCFERFDLIHLLATLGPLPRGGQAERQLRELLNQTLKYMKLCPAALTLNDEGQIQLFDRFPKDLDGPAFDNRVNALVNLLEALQNLGSQAPAAPHPSRSAHLAMLRP